MRLRESALALLLCLALSACAVGTPDQHAFPPIAESSIEIATPILDEDPWKDVRTPVQPAGWPDYPKVVQCELVPYEEDPEDSAP